jgi:two-component system, chemotaxis family, CheB/CheR fusion protein
VLNEPERPTSARVHRRVLLIEDNRDAPESLRELPELEGHEVAVAHDGPSGITRARELRPDLVLCDIGLPGMDGYAVARAFRSDEALKQVPRVALSGYALPDDLQQAAEAGFDGHLAKPPSLEKLGEIIGGLAGGALTSASSSCPGAEAASRPRR